MSGTEPPALHRYARFMRERFPLQSHLPMIAGFTWANISVASAALHQAVESAAALLTIVVVFLFFLRLRLFDELKDSDYDKQVNPNRPLAVGLVTAKELLCAIAAAVAVELILVLIFAPLAIISYLLALSFSLLMYKEFFIGRIIRPHLTTYAVLHTFVAVLMGCMVASVSHHAALSAFPTLFFAFGLVNWGLFNIFEFARKTFASEEERPEAESYSSKFSSLGAIGLAAAQVLLILAVVALLEPFLFSAKMFWMQLALAAALIPPMIFYLISDSKRGAYAYRMVSGAYIIISYFAFGWGTT